MNEGLSGEPSGVWIVQSLGEDEGRILALCSSVEEAELVTDELAALFPDLRYAFFSFGYRFGKQRPQ